MEESLRLDTRLEEGRLLDGKKIESCVGVLLIQLSGVLRLDFGGVAKSKTYADQASVFLLSGSPQGTLDEAD